MDLDEVTKMNQTVQVDLSEPHRYAIVFATDYIPFYLDTQQAGMAGEVYFQCARFTFRQPMCGFNEDTAKAYVLEAVGNE